MNFGIKSVKAFVYTAAIYLVIGIIFLLSVNKTFAVVDLLKWFIGLWLLSCLDLYALGRLVKALLAWTSDSSEMQENAQSQDYQDRKAAILVQSLFWGLAKIACLGLFGLIIWNAKNAPSFALVFGLGTLIVVPVVGGFWWSQKELKYA